MIDCCSYSHKNKNNIKECVRRKDKKTFKLPRRFNKYQCNKPNGYSMKSSCAPFKYCSKGGMSRKNKTHKKQKSKKQKTKNKKQFLYNPNNPRKSFDVYIDKNPKDTIPIKYTTINDVKKTIRKLERLYKTNKYPHKRIWQVGMIMYVRLKVLRKTKPKQFKLSQKYFKFLGERTKLIGENNRKKASFRII